MFTGIYWSRIYTISTNINSIDVWPVMEVAPDM